MNIVDQTEADVKPSNITRLSWGALQAYRARQRRRCRAAHKAIWAESRGLWEAQRNALTRLDEADREQERRVAETGGAA